MKYIRTPEGIFEFAKRFDLEHYKKVGFSDEDIVKKFIRNGNKIADTIEDLCDVFIKKSKEVGNDYFKTGTDAFTVFDKKYEYYKKWFEHYDYYGAIWTEKGLIYVAKLNKKGELELL